LIPAGATLLGTGQSTEERLMIRFTQVVFKDGSFENIQAQAADAEDKIVGLRGSRVGKYAMKYATAVGLNFVGGMAEGLQDREVVGQQVVTKPNTKNALLNGASKATLEMANETMTDLKNSAPIIQIPASQEIFIIFENGQ
jgi:type IV secretory pathway VirB10-like protein